MADLPLSPTTQRLVKQYVSKPQSVLILHGPTGVGKRVIAQKVVADVLGIVQDKLIKYPYLIIVEPEKDSISIDHIRRLQSGLVRTVPGDQPFRRAVIIDQAQTLTLEAQNALLKSLEEPPVDTIFVLCVDNIRHLLPTVVSRGRSLAVLPLTEAAAKQHFGDTSAVEKAFRISGGRAALLLALLSDDDHPLLASIDNAKTVLKQTPYDRLLEINRLSKDKPAVTSLLEALLLLARASQNAAVHNHKLDQAKRWHDISRQTAAAQTALDKNAGVKLVLTDLFLHL